MFPLRSWSGEATCKLYVCVHKATFTSSSIGKWHVGMILMAYMMGGNLAAWILLQYFTILYGIFWIGIIQVGLFCGNFPGGNCPGRSYPGWEFSGWELSGSEFSWVGIFLDGNFPDVNYPVGIIAAAIFRVVFFLVPPTYGLNWWPISQPKNI